jgi:hypothetical protein
MMFIDKPLFAAGERVRLRPELARRHPELGGRTLTICSVIDHMLTAACVRGCNIIELTFDGVPSWRYKGAERGFCDRWFEKELAA